MLLLKYVIMCTSIKSYAVLAFFEYLGTISLHIFTLSLGMKHDYILLHYKLVTAPL
jgi:hypothetical protein